MAGDLKRIKFVGSSLKDIRAFPRAVQHAIGLELMRVQYGGTPNDFKPMPIVGAGAYEIRVRIAGIWRAIYVAKLSESVFVLHAFHKKTQKTAQSDIDLAAKRYNQIGE